MPLLKQKKKALLVLEDGCVFEGNVFAGEGETMGEVVFNTGMTGYQEVITDPSYKGQIVTMTYPLVGNYGINDEDMESAGIHLEGFVVKEYQPNASNWRMTRSLKSFLEEYGKIGIEGIDTRALTRRLRLSGAMKGIIATGSKNIKSLLAKVRKYPGLVGRDLVQEVSCKKPYLWENGAVCHDGLPSEKSSEKLRVAVLDCGVKYNILRLLEKNGCEVLVLPATSTGADILGIKPDGVLLSNGPGDPAALPYIVDAARGHRQGTGVWDLPGTSDYRSGHRRLHRKTKIRPSWHQSAGEKRRNRPGGNYVTEPWFCCRSGISGRKSPKNVSQSE